MEQFSGTTSHRLPYTDQLSDDVTVMHIEGWPRTYTQKDARPTEEKFWCTIIWRDECSLFEFWSECK